MAITPNDPASFSPILQGYTGQGAFRFWCQTVLPLVYDDSLSYYELLNKVVNYLNNVISDVSQVETNVGEIVESYNDLETYVNSNYLQLVETYNQLENYVNEYFENLDVQNEINDKLDEMASSGALTVLIAPIIPQLVADWLAENITPTSPPVDASLSIQGAAADAKKTGEDITNLKSAITFNDLRTARTLNYLNGFSTTKNLLPSDAIHSGYYVDDSTGELVASDTYAYSDYIEINENGKYKVFQYYSSAWHYLYTFYAFYDSNGEYTHGGAWQSAQTTIDATSGDKYIRVSGPVSPYLNNTPMLYDCNINSAPAATDAYEDYMLTPDVPFYLFENVPFNLVANRYWEIIGERIGYPQGATGWSLTNRMPCNPGDTIIITATVASNYNLFFNTDTDGDVNKSFSVAVGENKLIVPNGAYYFALSNTTVGMNATSIKQNINAEDVRNAIATKAENIATNAQNIATNTQQISNIESTLKDGNKLVDIIPNSYVTVTGDITEYQGWSRTDYIECSDYDQLKVRFTGSSSMYNCFYNENKDFVSKFTLVTGIDNVIAIPDDAHYFILSNATTSMDTYKIWLDVVNLEILGFANPYYNNSALSNMCITYRFDSVTFSHKGQIVTKTWEDLKTALPSAPYFYVDDAKVRDVGHYPVGSIKKLIIDKNGEFKQANDTYDTNNTIIGAIENATDYFAHPTRAFGTLVKFAQRIVFNAPQEVQKEMPLDVVIALDAKEDTLYSTFDDSDFLMGYYSDNHMYGFEVGVETPMTTLALARYDKHMDFDSILCCGDSVLSYDVSIYPEDGSPYTALRQANFMLNRDKLLFVEGNHDRNIVSPVMPTKDFVNLMYRPLKRQDGVHFGGDGRPYFYRDFTDRKIRIVCLDLYDVLPDANYNYHSGYKQNQMEWLANTALNVPDSDWHVLVATHAAPYGESDGMTDNGSAPYNSNVLIGILESFKNGTSVTINSTASITEFPSYSITTNFTNAGNLIGCFVGHNHCDVDLVKNGIHYVSIECGYVEEHDKDYRSPFSYTAIAFDVVVINTTARTVNFHRIGYGNDRNYTY